MSVSTATDSVLGAAGIAALFIQGVTVVTAIGGLLLIGLRVAIAFQEHRLNRLKLKEALNSENDQ